MNSVPNSISAAISPDASAVWIRVEGRGSHANGPDLREFTSRMEARGHTRFVFDLGNCITMDSTFMGILAGLARRVRERNGQVELCRSAPKLIDLLTNLGLDHLLVIDPDGTLPAGTVPPTHPVAIDHRDTSPKEKALLVLDAHQELVDANPANLIIFRDVIDLISRQIESDKP